MYTRAWSVESISNVPYQGPYEMAMLVYLSTLIP